MPKFDLSTLELPPVAAKPLYAGVGATDLAVEIVRDAVADVQKRVSGLQKDLEPANLQARASGVFNTRRAQVEARVSDLQAEARTLPTKVQSQAKARYDEGVSTVAGTYSGLAQRGEQLVTRIRRQESTQQAASAAKTTTSKAKTTSTQAKKTASTTAKKASTSAKRTAKSASTTAKKSPARSSAKATGTSAKKTASAAARATGQAAKKVGD